MASLKKEAPRSARGLDSLHAEVQDFPDSGFSHWHRYKYRQDSNFVNSFLQTFFTRFSGIFSYIFRFSKTLFLRFLGVILLAFQP